MSNDKPATPAPEPFGFTCPHCKFHTWIAGDLSATSPPEDHPAAPAPDDDSLTIAYLMGYEDCRSGMEKRKWAQKVEAAMKDQP